MKAKSIYLLVLVPVLLLVGLLQYYKVEPFETFSLKYNDVNFHLQSKEIDPNIVFVAVDEPSVNEYGRWPWDREILAKGIDGLALSDVVMMDMIFSEPTTQTKDYALGDSIASLNASVCGFFLRKTSTQKVTNEELDILGDSSLDLLQSQISEHKLPKFISSEFAELNIAPIMQECTLSGSFTTLSESDHLFRSYPISVYYKNLLYPSLVIQALRLKFDKDISRVDDLHVEINKNIIGLNDKGFIRLNYYDIEQYDIVSIRDVIEGKIEPEYFRGKMVILGITEVGAGDIVSTPIGSIPGPLLHYTFLSNFLQNHLIVEPKNISLLFSIVIILVPFILIILFKKLIYRVMLNIMIYAILYITIRYMFISDMLYIDLFYPLIGLILSMASIEALNFHLEEKKGKFIKEAFSSYLSGDLLKQLVQNPQNLSLGGEQKELTVLFSDIRSFTSISEKLTPVALITLLNRYFTPMTNIVLERRGMLDKYIGDALMAFYNAPVDIPNHADAGCYSALDMIEKLNKLNIELQADGIEPIAIGIGLNTAEVVVGNMGSDSRFNYTVIGDGVNLASRVEGLTKNYGVEILITEFTVAKLSDNFVYRKIESVIVKGKDDAVLLYELMPNTTSAKNIKELYDEALELYIKEDYIKAKDFFSIIVDKYDDNPSKYYLTLIESGASWGVHKMTTK